MTLEFAPDLVVELGRGRGNSTCAFTQAAHRLDGCSVVSIGFDGGWSSETLPRISTAVGPGWFAPLEVIEGDVMDADFRRILENGTRILFFWDAHGLELGRFILSTVFPLLRQTPNIVAVHDVCDAESEVMSPAYVGPDGEWLYWQGDLVSPFPEIVPLFDFLCRNRLEFTTAASSLRRLRTSDGERWAELTTAFSELPAAATTQDGYWMYFQLAGEDLVFPPAESESGTRRLLRRLRRRH